MGAPKWFVKSRAFWGIFVMLLTTLLGDSDLVNIPAVTEFLEGLAGTGAVTIGAIVALIGNGLRKEKLTLWPSG